MSSITPAIIQGQADIRTLKASGGAWHRCALTTTSGKDLFFTGGMPGSLCNIGDWPTPTCFLSALFSNAISSGSPPSHSLRTLKRHFNNMNKYKISLQINVSATDLNICRKMLERQLSFWYRQLEHIVISIESNKSFGRFPKGLDKHKHNLIALITHYTPSSPKLLYHHI